MEAEARFRAMGSDVHIVVVDGPPSLLDAAKERIERLESLWSRFRPTSEISRLNALAGRPVRVSEETLSLVERALQGARITDGRYDPTVLGALVRAGYDRSFELLTDDDQQPQSPLGLGSDGIVVDRGGSTVALPAGTGFDPGGIGKGYAADLMIRELLAEGAAGACVNVGGDLRVDGSGPGGYAWTVALEHPLRPRRTELIGLRSGAVATSTRARRSWGSPGNRRHHLIDPATGRPADSGVLSATVIAAEAWQAEVLAKAAFVAGVSEGLFLMAAGGIDGLLIDDLGIVFPSAGLDRFLRSNSVSGPIRTPARQDGKAS